VYALESISFLLQPGRKLGLLGRTGSGKTTLIRLVSRLYDPTEGQIYLGDTDIRKVSLDDLRKRLGVVTQDVQLFKASLRDNITLFSPGIEDEDIKWVLRELDLWNWYSRLPLGLDTRIGDNGVGLSAGEAQLLAFARVFLKDPGLVILDEASSRLDPATEQYLRRAVNSLLQHRTGIIIAHRLSTVQQADDILILENGHIIEYGERERLAVNPSSHFYRLLKTGMEEALS
jgi:ATP-binding cassette subfamily B protein